MDSVKESGGGRSKNTQKNDSEQKYGDLDLDIGPDIRQEPRESSDQWALQRLGTTSSKSHILILYPLTPRLVVDR